MAQEAGGGEGRREEADALSTGLVAGLTGAAAMPGGEALANPPTRRVDRVDVPHGDDRAVPLHSFKFAAQLQYCQAGPAPCCCASRRAGHGVQGRPVSKQIEEAADRWAFLVKNLGAGQ